MNARKIFVRVVLGFIIILALVGGFFAFNNYIYNEKQGEPSTFEPYRGTLTGEYVCLPHKEPTTTHTDECAAGIKTNAGEYYMLDFNLMSQSIPQLVLRERFTASGTITPKERLSSNHIQQYPVVGIFSITDSFKKE